MKRIIILTLFLSVVAGLTLTNINVKKNPLNIDISIQNLEALGSGEGGKEDPCNIAGTMCAMYDENGNLIVRPGLSTSET